MSSKHKHWTLLALLAGLLMSGCGQKQNAGKEQQKEGRTIQYSGSVTFFNAQSDSLTTIGVAVAEKEEDRNMGLMDVNDLPENRGMLFIFDEPQPLSFWMANTPLPLDIIFIDGQKKIVRIHHNTEPFSQKQYSSGSDAQYVVETNGGFCVSHDIQEGGHISFER